MPRSSLGLVILQREKQGFMGWRQSVQTAGCVGSRKSAGRGIVHWHAQATRSGNYVPILTEGL